MKCICCNEDHEVILYSIAGFDIVKCRCGLARTSLPEGFDAASIYTREYFQGGQPDGYADYTGSVDALRGEFRRALERLPIRRGKLVEIGCAYGFFLDEAAGTFEAYGVEVADAAREAALNRGHTVTDTLDSRILNKGPFDVAVMLDVIEHLESPADTLRELHDAMRPGASLLITTGDFGSAVARLMRRHWRLMTPPQHLWFFTHQTITRLLSNQGFQVTSIDYPWKRVPLQLAAYQLGRLFSGGQRLASVIPSRAAIPVNLFDAMRILATRS